MGNETSEDMTGTVWGLTGLKPWRHEENSLAKQRRQEAKHCVLQSIFQSVKFRIERLSEFASGTTVVYMARA